MTIESPCISICQIDEDTGFCQGCYRTKKEIKQWKTAHDKTKSKILTLCEQRKAENINDTTT